MKRTKYDKLPCLSEHEYKALRKAARENKKNVNCFQEIVIELMNERRLKDVDVVKATGLAATTWNDWIRGGVRVQLVDENLLKVMKFFNVPLHFLCFGIGKPEPVFGVDGKEKVS